MGLPEIRAGLQAAFEAVPGIGPVLMYSPRSIPANFTLFVRRTGFETVRTGQVRGVRWFFAARLCILWQDVEQAEIDKDTLARAIIDAIDDDAHLGGALNSGLAEITVGDSDWFTVAGSEALWLYEDFEISVLEKGT